jgi:DNA polymerase III epsilon subunit-like protein
MECRIFDGAHVEKEALAVNGFKLDKLRDAKKKTDREVVEAFLEWMKTCNEWTLAGQNPSFDRDFLEQTAHRYHINWPLAQRTIDLHSVAYYHMTRAGKTIPSKNNHSALNLDAILLYVGLPERNGSHNALEDAQLEAEAFSRLFTGKGLLPEFEDFAVSIGLT